MLIVCLLLTSMLVACGGGGETDTGQTDTRDTAASPEAVESPEAMESPEAEASPEVTDDTAVPGEPIQLPEIDPADFSGPVVTSGSSTVFPITQRMAERFQDEGFEDMISVDEIGTGAGFQRFCQAGEADIANASRPIKDEELAQCRVINREPIEFRIGTDALAVVVSIENDFIDEITIEELEQIFTGEIRQWSELDPNYPAQDIRLFAPGTDSGTYDYFNEEVLDDDDDLIAQFQALNPSQSENDNVLVQGIAANPYAIGYFGYAYYEENQDLLKLLAVDGVEPNGETLESGEYPLARPLFIYSTAGIMREKPQVAGFINFYLSFVNEEIRDVGYFPASTAAFNEAKQKFLDAIGQPSSESMALDGEEASAASCSHLVAT